MAGERFNDFSQLKDLLKSTAKTDLVEVGQCWYSQFVESEEAVANTVEPLPKSGIYISRVKRD